MIIWVMHSVCLFLFLIFFVMFQGSLEMPVRQLYSPASLPGLAHDHDYQELSMEEDFLCRFRVTEITKEEIQDIELHTREQGKSSRWFEERRKRITASCFGDICKATDRRNMEALAASLINPKTINTAAVQHGKKYEAVALEQFEKKNGQKTLKCGLFVNHEFPYLGASPDSVIDSDTVVEVKCPFKAKNETVSPQTVPYLKLDSDGHLTLSRTHSYFYQVQGQMFCSGRKQCLFLVYTTKDLKAVNVSLDEEFVQSMVASLKHFFDRYFKPEILNAYFYRKYDELYAKNT